MIKAIFFDIDGTLVSHRTHQVPPSTIIALNKLKQQGIYTFIATGRHQLELQELPLEGLEFDAYITLNGQYCYNQEGLIYDLPIPKQDIQNILNHLQNNPFPCLFVESNDMYINYVDNSVKTAQEAISTSIPPIKDLNQGLINPIYQIIAYNMNQQKLNNLLPLIPHCKYTYWHKDALDILPSLGGKQNGIKKLLEHYHLQIEECMCFGDGQNDLCMFETIPFSIAMGNADQNIKKAAYDTTDDIDQDGIYNALIKHHIIK